MNYSDYTDYVQIRHEFIYPRIDVQRTNYNGDPPVITQQLSNENAAIYPLCAIFPSATISVVRNSRIFHPETFKVFSPRVIIDTSSAVYLSLEKTPVLYANSTWIVLRMRGTPEVDSLESIARELSGEYTCRTEDVLWQNPQNVTIYLNLTTQVVRK